MDDQGYLEKSVGQVEDLRTQSIRKPTISQVSILFSISIIIFLYLGSRVQEWELMPGLLITEFVLILIPPLVLLGLYKYDFKKVLRLNKVSISNVFLVIGIMIFALPVVGMFNAINLFLLKYIFGRIEVPQLPIAEDPLGLLLNIFVIGVSAGICEEVLFRGVIMRGFERFGAIKAILITALLFGLMHIDFQKLLGTFLLGALIGFLVYRTNSIYSGIIAHFTNNSIAVILTFVSIKLSKMAKNSGLEGIGKQNQLNFDFANMPQEQIVGLIIAGVIVILIALAAIAIFSGLLYLFIRNTRKQVVNKTNEPERAQKSGLLWLLPGLLFVGLLYVAEGVRLSGANVPIIKDILRSIGLG